MEAQEREFSLLQISWRLNSSLKRWLLMNQLRSHLTQSHLPQSRAQAPKRFEYPRLDHQRNVTKPTPSLRLCIRINKMIRQHHPDSLTYINLYPPRRWGRLFPLYGHHNCRIRSIKYRAWNIRCQVFLEWRMKIDQGKTVKAVLLEIQMGDYHKNPLALRKVRCQRGIYLPPKVNSTKRIRRKVKNWYQNHPSLIHYTKIKLWSRRRNNCRTCTVWIIKDPIKLRGVSKNK